MSQIIENVEAHYETHEVPFGRIYHWRQAHVILVCDCSEKLVFTGTSAMTACSCGVDYGALVHHIHDREGRLGDEVSHPWHYDVESQAAQHLRDEAAYPEGSPWRYNDVTAGGTDGE